MPEIPRENGGRVGFMNKVVGKKGKFLVMENSLSPIDGPKGIGRFP